jgi:hypothetical protein
MSDQQDKKKTSTLKQMGKNLMHNLTTPPTPSSYGSSFSKKSRQAEAAKRKEQDYCPVHGTKK